MGLAFKALFFLVDTQMMRLSRRALVVVLVVVGASVLVPTHDPPPAEAYAGAPWFKPSTLYDQNFPDPTVVRDGNTFYAYSTQTGGSYLPVMTSTDLRTWTARPAYNPSSFGSCVGGYDQFFNDGLPCPPAWALRLPGDHPHLKTPVWAPGVAKIGGKWLVYYAALQSQNPERQCISVAWSNSPLGPFRDDTTAPLQCDGDPGGSLDSEPFVDSNGTPWLVWKSNGILGAAPTRLWSRQLRPDGMGFAPGSSANLLLATQPGWEGDVIENPSMYRTPTGKLWLAYSGNSWESTRYAAGVASCASPAGPCSRVSGSPVLSSNGPQNGPGGASLFADTAGRLRVAYHAWNAPYSSYPAFPQCAAQNNCATQGQRRLQVGALVDIGGQLTANPIGSLDSATVSGNTVTLSGWAIEPDLVDAAAGVLLLVDGQWVSSATANRLRTDVDASYGFGANHGFAAQVPGLSPGQHNVCAGMFNTGAGTGAAWMGCRSITVAGASGTSPIGSLDTGAQAGPGTLAVTGWALDVDAGTGPIDVHVYVDGVMKGAFTANGSRPDVHAAFGLGANHGFNATVSGLSSGTRNTCVYAINAGGGANSLLGCKQVSLMGGSPIGFLDGASSSPGGIHVTGWAIDPDTASPVGLHVYVDGVYRASATADASRPDVGAAFPGYGSNHGYSVSVGGLTAGSHNVCVYALNQAPTPGGHRLLSCRQATTGTGSPFGSFDSAVRSSATALRLRGWTIDPDTASPIALHVYVDGVFRIAATANTSRPDVGAVFPGYGSSHGFDLTVGSVSPGTHTVCLYGINTGAGGHALISCRVVT